LRDPLWTLQGIYPDERSIASIAAQAVDRAVDVVGQSDAWIEEKLHATDQALSHVHARMRAVSGGNQRPRTDAQLTSLRRRAWELEARNVALRREQIARLEMAQAARDYAGEMSAPPAGVGRSRRVPEESLQALIARCRRDLGVERTELVLAHARALASHQLGQPDPGQDRGPADLSSIVSYRNMLRERLSNVDRRRMMQVRRAEVQFWALVDRHDSYVDSAQIAEERSGRIGRQRRRERRRRGRTPVQQARAEAASDRAQASALEPTLTENSEVLLAARRRWTHADNWADPYARLIAAETVIRARQQELAVPEVTTHTEQVVPETELEQRRPVEVDFGR
jgi:hypothetical protein